MSAPDRPHLTVFGILSIDGRLLSPTDEDLARQEAEVENFDAVLLDGCEVGGVIPSLSVWLGQRSASPAIVKLVEAASGRAVLFSTRAAPDVLPPRLEILRERADFVRRLHRLKREYKTRRLLCPLGCEVAADLVAQDLVDELRLALRPQIVGGPKSPTLTGLPRPAMAKSTRWSLYQLIREDDGCILVYRRA